MHAAPLKLILAIGICTSTLLNPSSLCLTFGSLRPSHNHRDTRKSESDIRKRIALDLTKDFNPEIETYTGCDTWGLAHEEDRYRWQERGLHVAIRKDSPPVARFAETIRLPVIQEALKTMAYQTSWSNISDWN